MGRFVFGIPCFGIERYKEQLMNQIYELHERAMKGDKEAVKEAYVLLKKARRIFLSDNCIKAYYGSIVTLLARDAIEPMERLEYAREGLSILDEVVADDPDNITVRILRGYVCAHLPEAIFHRTETSIEDFTYLISRYKKEPGIISKELYDQLVSQLELARKKKNHTGKRIGI